MRITCWIVLALACANGSPLLAAEPAYYRQPTLHGERVVFTAEGDLWDVPLSGGIARRLTTHPSEEAQAAISPDGRWIGFVGSYDAGSDVYVMPADGGEPRRLSHDGGRVWLQGFAPSGELLYTSENIVGPTLRRVLRLVDPVNGAQRELPLADANEAVIGSDGQGGNAVWFNRFGLQASTDNARGYRGGAMAQLWCWSLDSQREATPVAHQVQANLSQPMLWQDRLIVVSDEDGVANLWSLARDGSERRQLTRHREFEVRGASQQGGRVVYQSGADLRVYDLASDEDRAIAIQLASDFAQRRERWIQQPLDYLGSLALSGNGQRVALNARGRITTAGLNGLRRIDIAVPPSARAREAVLSKDERWVYAITDQGSRSEVWSYPADGSPGGRALTDDGEVHRWRLYPSPDGRYLAHDDKLGRLWLLQLDTGRNRLIDTASHGGDDAYAAVVWSPDGRYLATARADSARLLNQIVLIDVASGATHSLTSDRYESHSPAFSRDGRWLYFLSERSFVVTPAAPWGDRNTGPFFDRRSKVYALALQSDTRFPFLPVDELTPPGGAPTVAADVAATALPAIEFSALADRLYEVPVAAGNYSALAVDAARLYLLDRDAAVAAKPVLKTLAIGNAPAKLEIFASDVASFTLSADARRVLLAKTPAEGASARIGDLLILDAAAKAPDDLSRATLSLAGWSLRIDPREEWRQMFDDAWRMHGQFSFDPGMRGQDWAAVRARYAPLLPRVGDRAELDDLLAQMSGEHGILHSQVRGAEYRIDAAAAQGSALGARYADTHQGLRIERIYRGDRELPSERGPLLQPGVNAREGDLIVAVNGTPVRRIGELAAALRQQAGQQVLLQLQRAGEQHRSVVRPVALDRDAVLRYGDWVQVSRDRVDAAGQGRIGYLHLRAMGPNDIASFVRDFYAQFDRDGLIVDVRRNRGGNIDSWVIEKLLRRAWAFWQPTVGAPYWNMQQTFRGHLVVLADQFTYSDGETFAAGIKALGLGPVIGMRTSGAGVWLSDRNRLADNGLARVAEYGQFDAQGRWLIEGHGVQPDIQVDNLPFATAQGGDAQLQAALDYLHNRLREQPVGQPAAQPIPPRGQPGHDGTR